MPQVLELGMSLFFYGENSFCFSQPYQGRRRGTSPKYQRSHFADYKNTGPFLEEVICRKIQKNQSMSFPWIFLAVICPKKAKEDMNSVTLLLMPPKGRNNPPPQKCGAHQEFFQLFNLSIQYLFIVFNWQFVKRCRKALEFYSPSTTPIPLKGKKAPTLLLSIHVQYMCPVSMCACNQWYFG